MDDDEEVPQFDGQLSLPVNSTVCVVGTNRDFCDLLFLTLLLLFNEINLKDG